MKCITAPVGNGTATKGLQKIFGGQTRKKFNRITTKGSYTWNTTHNAGSTAI
jgi:hypothetical protein